MVVARASEGYTTDKGEKWMMRIRKGREHVTVSEGYDNAHVQCLSGTSDCVQQWSPSITEDWGSG